MKKIAFRLLALVCVMMLVMNGTVVPVKARDLSDIQADINAKKEQLNQLEDKINANRNNRAAAEAALAEYQTQYNELLGLIDEQEDSINRTMTELDFKTQQLSDTIESIGQNKELFETRLKAIYDLNSTNAMMSTLLSVQSFGEFVQATDAMKRISKEDTALLDKLVQQKEQYEVQRVDLESLIETLNADLERLQQDRDWCTAKMEEMNTAIANANLAIQAGEEERKLTQQEIKELQEEYARIFRQLQQKGSQKGDNSVRFDGPMSWPVQGIYRVSSWFGDPRSNTGYHYGIDIPGPAGSPILAAGDGVVMTAEWHNSYGYYVVIDHGQGLRTLYAHNSQLLVAAGNPVYAGQNIAAMGNTGDSYGSHLHFEVHENGARQNPAGPAYLNIH